MILCEDNSFVATGFLSVSHCTVQIMSSVNAPSFMPLGFKRKHTQYLLLLLNKLAHLPRSQVKQWHRLYFRFEKGFTCKERSFASLHGPLLSLIQTFKPSTVFQTVVGVVSIFSNWVIQSWKHFNVSLALEEESSCLMGWAIFECGKLQAKVQSGKSFQQTLPSSERSNAQTSFHQLTCPNVSQAHVCFLGFLHVPTLKVVRTCCVADSFGNQWKPW